MLIYKWEQNGNTEKIDIRSKIFFFFGTFANLETKEPTTTFSN